MPILVGDDVVTRIKDRGFEFVGVKLARGDVEGDGLVRLRGETAACCCELPPV
jgi:hypothetical protein